MSKREELIEYLIDNKDYFKDKYKDKIDRLDKAKETNDNVFHEEIDKQFRSVIIRSMVDELSSYSGADAETILIVLEDMNLTEYLK